MYPHVGKFVRIFFVCWIPLFLGIAVVVIALSVRGELVDVTRADTWLVFGTSLVFAAFWALLPAVFMAVFVAAVVFKRNAVHSGTWPYPKVTRAPYGDTSRERQE